MKEALDYEALEERTRSILVAVIQSFIQTAEPVGSRVLSKRFDFGLSPATIRNVMSDLEELGFLEQPHTSAGVSPRIKAIVSMSTISVAWKSSVLKYRRALCSGIRRTVAKLMKSWQRPRGYSRKCPTMQESSCASFPPPCLSVLSLSRCGGNKSWLSSSWSQAWYRISSSPLMQN